MSRGGRLAGALVVLASCGRLHFGDLGSGAGGGDGGDGNGSNGGEGAPALSCGATLLLSDDFEDGVTASAWAPFNDGGYTIAETGGALSVTYAASVPSAHYGGYTQQAAMNIVGACFVVEIVQAPNPATTAYAYARIGTASKKVTWLVQSGLLTATEDAVAIVTVGQIAFDPVGHRFLRLRENAGNFDLDTAPALAGPYTPFGVIGVSTVALPAATVELGAATDTTAVASGGAVLWGSVLVAKP